MLCPHCGKQIHDDDTFCAFCGETISSVNPVPRPTAPPPPAPTQSAGKPKKIVLILVCVLLAAAGIGAGACFLPGIINSRKNTPPENPLNSGGQSVVTTAAQTEESATTLTASVTTTAEEIVTEAATTTEAEVTTETPTKSPEELANEEKEKIYKEAMGFSTSERPMLDEFEWTMGQDGFVYTPPENADMLNNPISYSGGWKAMIVYNPTNAAGTYIRELDNINIVVEGDSCTITIDWFYMYIEGSESYREDDMEDTVFPGYVADTGVYASGEAEISINTLWKADGKEYALGTLITSDGLPAYLAMVR